MRLPSRLAAVTFVVWLVSCAADQRAGARRDYACPNTFYLTQIVTPRDRDVPLDGALLFDTRRRDGSITGTLPAIYDPELARVLPTNQRLVLARDALRIPLVVTPIGGGFFRVAPATRPAPGEYQLLGFADTQDIRFRFGGASGPRPTPVTIRSMEYGERGGSTRRFHAGVYFATDLPTDTAAVALVPRDGPWVVFDRFGHEPPAWAGADGSTGGPCLPAPFERASPDDGMRVRPVAIDVYARTSPPGPEFRVVENTEIPEYIP